MARRIVVLGGGFAGVECARRLESEFGSDPGTELVMVSEDNFMLFTPMLPQVASGMIETRHIVLPIRTVCRRTRFFEGRVRSIDPRAKSVTLWGSGGRGGVSVPYDFLVVALGSETNFFGMADVERNAYTMKTLNDAVALRNRVIDVLERAENEADPARRGALLCFVVAGAGFAGIETAGELMDLLLDARVHYPTVRREEIRVVVLEALPTILPGFDPGLAEFARRKMGGRGIEIMLETAVTGFDGDAVATRGLGGGGAPGEIRTRTLVWTAGVTPVNTIKRSVFRTEKGKVVVDGNLEVPGFPGVFAVGDCAACADPGSGRPYPPTAQVAIMQARAAVRNLAAAVRGGDKEGFAYRTRGQMAVIGKRTGIATVLGMNISGFWAWAIWRVVYLSKIPTLDKKTRILLDWVIDLFFARDISRLKIVRRRVEKEYRVLDEVDDVW